jgi:hypothetical protein
MNGARNLPEGLPAGEREAALSPHNREAEEALLGALLVAPSFFPRALELGIGPSDFFIHRNAWVFQAARCVLERGDALDILPLAAELEANGKLAEVGDKPYLMQLFTAPSSSQHVETYARLVKADSRKRRALALATRLVQGVASSKNGSVDELLEEAARELDALKSQIPGKDPWKIFSLVDAFAPRPPIVYAVEGLFPIPSLVVLYGAPGALKTAFAMHLAACVAGGVPFLEPLPGNSWSSKAVSQSPVLHLDFDNGKRETSDRAEAVARGLGLSPDAPFFYCTMPTPRLDAGNPKDVDALLRRIEGCGARVVTIDNLGVISGGADENSGEMIRVMDGLRRISDEASCNVTVMHHERKAKDVASRLGDRMRGHSSIEAAVDLALLIERDSATSPNVTIRCSKTRGMTVEPFGAAFAFEHKPGTTQLHSFRFFGFPVTVEDDAGELDETILETAGKQPWLSGNKLMKAVKSQSPAGHGRITQAINSLAARGLLSTRKGSRGSCEYAPK